MLFTQVSCDDFLTQVSENNTNVSNHFATEEDVEAAVYGMHQQFRQVMGDITQIYRDRGVMLDKIGMRRWEQSQSHNFSGYYAKSLEFGWSNEYRAVSAANLVIGNVHRAGLPKERQDFYMGQALCIRAYLYFHMIRLWGDVPLLTDYEDLREQGRTPWREVAQRLADDLKLAAGYLPPADELRDSKGRPIRSRQIPSRGTAYALLAHVYAWMAGYGQEPAYYAEGIAAAQEVLRDPNYGLVDSPEEVCTVVLPGNSKEGIFEVAYDFEKGEVLDYGSYLAGFIETWPVMKGLTPATRRTFYILNTTVEDLYDVDNDLRVEAFFADFRRMRDEAVSITRGAAYVRMWRYPEYYTSGVWEGDPWTFRANDILIRLADIILLKAEMEAATGDNAAAEADLNRIRSRAGAGGYSSSEGDLRRAIQLERDKELIFQTLVRYFDYMRNHSYNLLKGGYRELTAKEVEDGALFLPVSVDAFTNNPQMKQTTYWVGKF